MDRLTNDMPSTNFAQLMNFAYAKDGLVKLAYANGTRGADLCEYISEEAAKIGCLCAYTPEDVIEGSCMECDCTLALLYIVATQAAELRGRLKMVEDILGDSYDLDQLGGWITVTERMPVLHTDDYEEPDGSRMQFEVSEDQWVITASGIQTKARCETGVVFQGWVGDLGETVRDVTHWMPLPEPPKEVE